MEDVTKDLTAVIGNTAKTESEKPAKKAASKTTKIKLHNYSAIVEPGKTETYYGIDFVAQKNGTLVAEILTKIAEAGLKAGLYKAVK